MGNEKNSKNEKSKKSSGKKSHAEVKQISKDVQDVLAMNVEELARKRYAIDLPEESLKITEFQGIDHSNGLDTMIGELQSNGILSPIVVCGPYKGEKQPYTVVDGAKTLLALRQIRKGLLVPCYVVAGAIPPEQVEYLAVCCNRVHRKEDADLNLRYAEIVLDLWGGGRLKRQQTPDVLSKVSGLSIPVSEQYISVAENAYPYLKEKVQASEVPVKVASKIVETAVKEPEAEEKMQKNLTDVYLSADGEAKAVAGEEIKSGRGTELLGREGKAKLQKLVEKKRAEEDIRQSIKAMTALVTNKAVTKSQPGIDKVVILSEMAIKRFGQPAGYGAAHVPE